MLLCSVQSQVQLIQNQNQNKAGRRENLLIAKDESFGEIMIRLETENNKDDPPE